MEAVLKQDILSEAYIDTEKLIKKICWNFHRKYGGDVEEWIAEANLIFIDTYNSYDNQRGAFSTWLSLHIWKRLLTYKSTLNRQCPPVFANLKEDVDLIKFIIDPTSITTPFFSSMELLDGMKQSTIELIEIIWNPPKKLTKMKIKSGASPCHTKVALRKYLRKADWSWKRIQESFAELEGVINA